MIPVGLTFGHLPNQKVLRANAYRLSLHSQRTHDGTRDRRHRRTRRLVQPRAGNNGMLALEDRRICQILEGPAHAVDFLYVSIKQDERHFRVTELARHRIFHTSFERWGMVRRPMIDMVTLAFRE
ncbi:BLUF domain-containing protein [Aliihoeflea sp. 40Bstr573]|uniref:BLUF domain-containing protein n=1 Tax=Aliihoeflea sp. 40Bstr573 TaxID=2696467 RepID=UPI003532138D